MTDIKSMLLSELQEDFALRGLQKFRAAQVYRWLHQRGATSFDEMTDLSKDPVSYTHLTLPTKA